MKFLPLLLALFLFQGDDGGAGLGGDDGGFGIDMQLPEGMGDEVKNPEPEPEDKGATAREDALNEFFAAFMAAIGTVVVVSLIVHVIVWAIVSYILAQCLRVVPEPYRTMSPGAAYLMIVPIVNFIWVPIVYLNITASHARFFQAAGRHDVGDCGRTLAVWTAICWYLWFLVLPAIPLGFLLLFLFAAVHYYKGQVAATIALGRA